MIVAEEELLLVEKAREDYPVGTKYKCAMGIAPESTVGKEDIITFDGLTSVMVHIVGKGVIYYNGVWAEKIATPKPSRKKVYPLFYQSPSGEVKTFQVNQLVPRGVYRPSSANINSQCISPYSNYIPMCYLLRSPILIDLSETNSEMKTVNSQGLMISIEDAQKFLKKFSSKKHPLSRTIWNKVGRGLIKGEFETKEMVSGYIDYDSPLEVYNDSMHTHLYTHEMLSIFSRKDGNTYNFSMRSYRGVLGSLLLMIGERGTSYEFSIVGVMQPEDFIYQKYHILTKGCVDLTKVTVLIDRELDSVDFPIPALRKLYKSQLEPYINTLGCSIWKVPKAYINENCFMGKFYIESRTSRRMREESAEIIDSFYEHIKHTHEKDGPNEIQETDSTIIYESPDSIGHTGYTGITGSVGYAVPSDASSSGLSYIIDSDVETYVQASRRI